MKESNFDLVKISKVNVRLKVNARKSKGFQQEINVRHKHNEKTLHKLKVVFQYIHRTRLLVSHFAQIL